MNKKPKVLLVRHLFNKNTKVSRTTEPNRSANDSQRLPEITSAEWFSIKEINRNGNPIPIKMSNTLEPMALFMAIPERPCFAVIADESRSGTDVPIAITVSPIKTSGMLRFTDRSTAK